MGAITLSGQGLTTNQGSIKVNSTNSFLLDSSDRSVSVHDGSSWKKLLTKDKFVNATRERLSTVAAVQTNGGILNTGGGYTKIIFDSNGDLYWAVANFYNGSSYTPISYVYKISWPNQLAIMTQFTNQTSINGDCCDLVFDSSGNLYWALGQKYNGTTWNNFTSYVYKITSGGTKTTFASHTGTGIAGTALAFDSSGNLYWAVSSYYNDTTRDLTSYVYKITSGGTKTTFASQATNGAHGTSLAFDSSGNLYWAVSNFYSEVSGGTNLTSYVYKITPAGTKTTFASQTTSNAPFNDLKFDSSGNLYWAVMNRYNDQTLSYNLDSYVYKITPAGTKTTFASSPTSGGMGTSLAFDSSGNLYWSICNEQNGFESNLLSYVYKIKPDGTKIPFASIMGNSPRSHHLLFDSNENLYWAFFNDTYNTSPNTNSYIYLLNKIYI